MVERQIAARGIRDPRVLAAMAGCRASLRRPTACDEFAYEDSAAADRRGPDDLAALHRRADDRGGRDRARRPRARGRRGLRLRRGGPEPRIAAGSSRSSAMRRWPTRRSAAARRARLSQRRDAQRRRHARLARATRPSTRSSSRPAGRTCREALQDQLAIGGRLVIPVGGETRQRCCKRHAARPRTIRARRTSARCASCR